MRSAQQAGLCECVSYPLRKHRQVFFGLATGPSNALPDGAHAGNLPRISERGRCCCAQKGARRRWHPRRDTEHLEKPSRVRDVAIPTQRLSTLADLGCSHQRASSLLTDEASPRGRHTLLPHLATAGSYCHASLLETPRMPVCVTAAPPASHAESAEVSFRALTKSTPIAKAIDVVCRYRPAGMRSYWR
jgi:hypothetical protein